MFRKFTLFILLVLSCTNIFAQIPDNGFPDNFNKLYFDYGSATPGVDCMNDRLVLKINSMYRTSCGLNNINIPELIQLFNYAKVTEVRKIYPYHVEPAQEFDAMGRRLVDLSLIYSVTFSGDMDVRKLITELNGLESVEYAQPRFIVQPQWMPNDTSLGQQWALSKVKAFQAWDLDTGDYNVIVGVVDGGTNFTHPDLLANVHYNMGDTIDGIDNDGDGFIDNYRGWDVGDWDNNPQYIGAFNSAHGTSMCGLSAGTPNNIAGMSGSGYRCSYMPVKLVHSSYGWIAGYEGLVYAADHGAGIINASWGGTIPGPYGQDVVNYVTINQGSLLFAAAGNSNNTVRYYPASYENVICVGGTDSLDAKSPGSCYYEQVDIVAPGEKLFEPYATAYGNGYGTSDASAFTSGAAGIVQSYHSSLTPLQIGAVMLQASYRIDTIPANAAFINKQGSGRLDMYNALVNPMRPFIDFNNRVYTDNNDEVFVIGDTVELSGNMLNILDTSSAALMAYITDNSPYVEWLDSNVNLGVINTLQFASTSAQPFSFRILPGCPVNQSVLIKVSYFDGIDTLNVQYFTIYVNRDYYNVDINNLHTTVTTTGRIGYSDKNTLRGVGYRMEGKENNLLGIYYNPMGLFLSKGSPFVSDQTLTSPLGPCCPFNHDNDIVSTGNITVNTNSIVADLEVTSRFDDSGAGANAVGLDVQQKLYGWADSVNSDFLILEYQFENNTGNTISNWYAGLFADFDLPDSLVWNLNSNLAYYDTVCQCGIVQNTSPRYFVGIKLLSTSGAEKYYANNNDGSFGCQNIYDGFSGTEKYAMMNPTIPSNLSQATDVSHYMGVAFNQLDSAGCGMMYMALVIGNSLNDLRANALAAQTKFDGTFNIWTGNGSDSDWHNSLNWSQGSVPDFTDHVIIPDTRPGNGYFPIISTANGMVKNIEIRCGGRLEVNNPYKLLVGN